MAAKPPATPDEFMRRLEHPLKPALAKVRTIVAAASPKIAEGIKWNCPSFYVEESGAYFATVNIHKKAKMEDVVMIVFHLGAKVKPGVAKPAIRDPGGMLEWLGKDRAVARFGDLKQVRAEQKALRSIVRQWIDCL
ncbi:MAG: DUF1801 domain-containing protein [Gemmatimonadales bacterium]|nr:DUF1801 domain-containing protein [Gemmatimonadales bacterium]